MSFGKDDELGRLVRVKNAAVITTTTTDDDDDDDDDDGNNEGL
jgi:hypothetical protein